MKIKFYSFVLVIGIISGCASAPHSPRLPPVQLSIPSTEQQAMLKQATISSLKDPDSAKFNGQMVLVDKRSACVEVNARNTFGGYTGFQQAMLVRIDGDGWQVIGIKDISRELCINSLHSIVQKNF